MITAAPPSTVRSPPRLFEPERVSIPALVLVRLPVPEMLPEIVVLEAPSIVRRNPLLMTLLARVRLFEAAVKLSLVPSVIGRLTV